MTAGERGVKNGGIFLAWRPGSTHVETGRARSLSTTHWLVECKQMYMSYTDRVSILVMRCCGTRVGHHCDEMSEVCSKRGVSIGRRSLQWLAASLTSRPYLPSSSFRYTLR
jgi:hypothetical protein